MRTSGLKQICVALIGFGYWGKKIFHDLFESDQVGFIYVVDPHITKEELLNLSKYKARVSVSKFQTVLDDESISHVFIATPEETHFEIAKTCLNKKKHTFVEKPLCLKASQAKKLVTIADTNSLNLYVDYVFLYDPYVKKITKILDSGKIGTLDHIHSVRYSVGIIKPNITVFDDLAIHDIYLGQRLFANTIKKVQLISQSVMSSQINQGQVLYHFDQSKQAHSKTLYAEYSWIQPEPKRTMTFICSSGSLVWDKNLPHLLVFTQNIVKQVPVKSNKSALHTSIQEFFKNSPKTMAYEKDIRIIEKLRKLSK